MRTALCVAYLAVVAFGLWTIDSRARAIQGAHLSASCRGCRPDAHYVAARALPARHRIVSRDLAEPDGLPRALAAALPARQDLIGRYLAAAAAEGGALDVRSLRAAPDPTHGPDIVLEAVPVDEALRDQLDVGTPIRLCTAESTCSESSFRVFAVACPGPDGTHCAAMLEVPLGRREALVGDYREGRRVVTPGPWQGEE